MNVTRTATGTFPSQAAAARALGVSAWTVAFHLDRGTIDRAGTGHKPRACEWEGQTFPSIADAARAFGISRQAMRQRIERAKKKGQQQ